MRIVYLAGQPISKRNLERFGINDFLKQGYEIIYADLCPYLKSQQKFATAPGVTTLKITTLREVIKLCLSLTPQDVVFDQLGGLNTRTLAVYWALRLRAPRFATIMVEAVVSWPVPNKKVWPRVLRYIKNPAALPFVVCRKILSQAKPKTFGVPQYDYVLAMNRKAIAGAQSRLKNPNALILGSTEDYVIAKNTEVIKDLKDEAYIAYLDLGEGYHPDNNYLGVPHDKMDFDAYYAALNRYMDALEAFHKMPVKVACHPRLDLELCKKLFNGRDLYHYQTAALTKGATYAFTTYSTSISFAVIFNKPIRLVLTPESNQDPRIHRDVHGLADALGVEPLLVGGALSPEELAFELPAANYKTYMDNFIKAAEDDSDVWPRTIALFEQNAQL